MNDISLAKIYRRRRGDRDIFQDLMPFKVKEILLVATYYDAYSIVREGQFSDKIFGEYHQLNLYAAPRFTSVASTQEALNVMKDRHFDMVIIMAGLDKTSPLDIAKAIRAKESSIPVLMLLNNNYDIPYFIDSYDSIKNYIDRVFVWNGDTKIFMAMIKFVEDRRNVKADTKLGDVRVILLVEDSVKYYSRYLPMLYSTIMEQTQDVIANEEENSDELHVILRMRARPKVILVSSYERAMEVISAYGNNILCIISDVSYYRNSVLDDDAGVDLIKYVKEKKPSIPCLLQSHDIENSTRAKKIKADFINKNSDTLAMDVNKFIHENLGFGDFIFKDPKGNPIAKAKTFDEFENLLKTIPEDSLKYHTNRNAISTWLMARGEIQIAKRLRRYKTEDFESTAEMRNFCLMVFESARLKQLRGRIVKFRSSLLNSSQYILRMGKGSLGGKGRGLAFVSNFIENIYFKKIVPEINIRIPKTAIIGVEEYDNFIELNDLYNKIYVKHRFKNIKETFLKAELSANLKQKLVKYLNVITKPLAVRSSGLFEDSLRQPFAGVYETFIIPNNSESFELRYKQLEEAIKLTYASIFSESAQAYFNATDYKIEEEKMAIVIQEVVGQQYENYYYPNISGVAQSYNYYPFSYMKPEDGFAVAAVGLGAYVVGGEKTHRFCPNHPKLQLASIPDQIKSSQSYFYAIDLSNPNINLTKDGEGAAIKALDIKQAELHGNLVHCAAVYDGANDRLDSNFDLRGPRVVNFSNILQYDYIPMAKSISVLLNMFKEAMGSPVEIEFALDLSKTENNLPTFYILQIKPLIRLDNDVDINIEEIDHNKVLLYSEKGMGNGELNSIKDVIFVNNENFDKTMTKEIAEEMGKLNEKMSKKDKEYILIGPGRWGTKDRFVGIPVLWSQISKAKVIIEHDLEDFPLDASLGSHFFHNVTSMNVGYYSVQRSLSKTKIDFDALKNQKVISKSKYLTHIRFKESLKVRMDGKKQIIVIEE